MTRIYAAQGWGFGLETDPRVPKISCLLSWAAADEDWDWIFQQSYLRSLAVDSGAYSFATLNKTPTVQAYADWLHRRNLVHNPLVDAIFALDVIDSWQASKRNTDKLLAMGIPAIPTWHAGEPYDVLQGMAKDYPRIAIGAFARRSPEQKMRVAEEVFSRVWPCRIHGFGLHSEKFLERFPFDSVDATSQWYRVVFTQTVKVPNGTELQPVCTRGVYPRSRKAIGPDACMMPMHSIARWVLALEQKSQLRWGKELARFATPAVARNTPGTSSAQQE